jgi:hypothetical protein
MRIRVHAAIAVSLLLAVGMMTGCGPKEQQSSKFVDTPAATATAPAPASAPVKLLDVGNIYGVRGGGKAPSFTIDKAATIVDISDYHYVIGGGPTPGTIGLKSADGKTYGPWPCVGLDGQNNVKNATWQCKPNVEIPAGTYTIVDSGPSTWSTDDKAKGLGFSTVLGVYAK